MKNASKRVRWSYWKQFLFLILGIVLALVVSLTIWFHELDKNPDVVIPTPTPPAINAYTYYKAAADSVVDRSKIVYASFKWNPTLRHSRDPDDHPYTLAQQEALVKENAGAIQLVHMGFRYPYQEPPGGSINTGFPSYTIQRDLSRLLALQAQVKIEQGQWDGAITPCLDAIQLGEAIPHGGGLVGMMDGVACELAVRYRAWVVVAHLNAAQAQAATRRLEAIRADHVPFAVSLQESEWKDGNMYLASLRRPDWVGAWGNDGGWNSDGSWQEKWQYRRTMLRTLMTGKRTIFANYTHYMDQEIANAKQPYASHLPDPPIPDDPMNQRWLRGSLRGVWFDEVNTNTQNALLLTVLALRAYQLDHGVHPATLSALTPHYLKAVPNDPCALSGPLHYKRTGSDYLLYSVGPDGKDDGGKPIYDQTRRGNRYVALQNNQGDIVAGINIE